MLMFNFFLKISSLDYLISIFVVRDIKINDSVFLSEFEMYIDENKVSEIKVRNKEMEGGESLIGRGNKSGKIMILRVLLDDMDEEKNFMRYFESDLDRVFVFMMEDDDIGNVFEVRKDFMGSDNENEDEEENLKLLRMSIVSVFG